MADSTCGGRSVDEPGWPRFSSSLSTVLTVVSATCLAFLSNCRHLAGAEAFRLSFLLLAPLLGLKKELKAAEAGDVEVVDLE